MINEIDWAKIKLEYVTRGLSPRGAAVVLACAVVYITV